MRRPKDPEEFNASYVQRLCPEIQKDKFILEYTDKHFVFGSGGRHVIYNWPAIIASGPGSTVFVAEGEKNASDLIKHKLLATCVVSPKDWPPECAAPWPATT